jgi:methylated-DNA-protein-cysteine methyltransferase-like protein
MNKLDPPSFYEKVYAVVRQIPPGQVTSYGRIAKMLDAPQASRAVGYAMRALRWRDESEYQNIPWFRVLNSQGGISLKGEGAFIQADRLMSEGIEVSKNFKVDLDEYLWEGLLPHQVRELLHSV